jgi:predicted Na+-dependent transporter
MDAMDVDADGSSFDALAILNLLLLALLMIGLGASIDFFAFRAYFRRPTGILTCQTVQFLWLPSQAYLIAKAFDFEDAYAVSLVVLGCCPGGALTNILCFLMRADLDLSVAMTAASSLVSCGMLPLNIYIFTSVLPLDFADDLATTAAPLLRQVKDVEVDYVGVIISALTVVAGTFIGVAIQRQSQKAAQIFAKVGSVAAVTLLVMAFVGNGNSETPVWEAPAKFWIAAGLHHVGGYFLSFILASGVGLPKPSRVSIAVECSIQNQILALSILNLSFPGEANKATRGLTAIVPIAYSLIGSAGNVVYAFIHWRLGNLNLPPSAKLQDLLESYSAQVANAGASFVEGAVDPATGVRREQTVLGTPSANANSESETPYTGANTKDGYLASPRGAKGKKGASQSFAKLEEGTDRLSQSERPPLAGGSGGGGEAGAGKGRSFHEIATADRENSRTAQRSLPTSVSSQTSGGLQKEQGNL